MNKNSKIYVAGSGGLLGSAIVRRLQRQGYENVLGFSSKKFDLTNPIDVEDLFDCFKPEYVFLAAARVGGVCSNNKHEADFLQDNLLIQTNVLRAAHWHGVKKLLFTGSACVYPRLAPNPILESDLLTGPLEPSNQWYAVAKIAGIKLCQAYWKQHGSCFISVMPTNLYGPGDHYDKESSHVLPAMLRRFHEAKMNKEREVICWGSGTPTREFLYSDDCADACITAMTGYDDIEPINIGSGHPVSISELATACANTVGFRGAIGWDNSRPDGTPLRRMSTCKMDMLGWSPRYSLMEGLKLTYADFVAQQIGPERIYDNAR